MFNLIIHPFPQQEIGHPERFHSNTRYTYHNYRSICVRSKVACLKNVTKIRRASGENESMGSHVPTAGRRQ